MSYPTFSFARICGPKFQNLCLFVTGYLQIGTHLNTLFNSKCSGFRHFKVSFQYFELKGVWLQIKLNQKGCYSPLILHSVRLLQKMCLNTQKTSVSSCRSFTLLLQLLKSKNSVLASCANMSKLLLLLR